MKFQLSNQVLDFLEANLLNDSIQKKIIQAREKGEILVKEKYRTGKYSLELDKNEIQNIIEKLSDLFAEKGLEDNSEPNSFGIYLENLIDTFTSFK